MASTPRDQIAQRYGFATYADLLAASFRLPMSPGEVMQSYVGKHPNGHWFLWQDAPHAKEQQPPRIDGK